jgi:hypothetical protein
MSFKTLVRISLIALSLSVFIPISLNTNQAYAEVVDVPGQGDCPGGNEGWQRHLEVNATTHVEVTHCVRIENVPVAPAPSDTSTSSSSPSSTPVTTTPETVSRVAGASDPYPNVSTGGEIPGTRTWSTSETSWAQFATNSMASGWRCPNIYGPNGDPYAGESNGFDSATGKWFRVCVKNPWREPIPLSVQSNYQELKTTAMADALAKSLKWNTENPGLQKCFQWGPITSPSGGSESGGVCANPIGVSSGTSQSDTRTYTTQTETRTAAIAVVAAISNIESKTISAASLLKTYDASEKEAILNVSLKSTKSSVINVSTDFSNINVKITATKQGSKTIVFNIKTNSEGDSQIKTSKNLTGFLVTLAVNGVKLDSDKAIKK